MWTRISRFYPPWLELIPILMLGFVLIYTAAHYALLPEQMPTHFGISGQPDDWSAKGFWTVYLPLLIGSVVWLSVVLINYFLIIKPEDPGQYMSMNAREKEKLGPVRLEEIRTISARAMMIINLTMVALIATIQYGSVNTALGLQKGLGWGVSIFAIALIIESIGLLIKAGGVNFSPKLKR